MRFTPGMSRSVLALNVLNSLNILCVLAGLERP